MMLTKLVLLLCCDEAAFPVLLLAPVCVDGCEGGGSNGAAFTISLPPCGAPAGGASAGGGSSVAGGAAAVSPPPAGGGGDVGQLPLASGIEPSGHVCSCDDVGEAKVRLFDGIAVSTASIRIPPRATGAITDFTSGLCTILCKKKSITFYIRLRTQAMLVYYNILVLEGQEYDKDRCSGMLLEAAGTALGYVGFSMNFQTLTR